MLALASVLLLLASAPGPVSAQVVVGELVEQETGAPIAGAFVFLMDLRGERLGGTMTRSDGRFRFETRRAGRYQLRAERIGYVTAVSDTLELAAGPTLQYRFSVETRPFALEGIRVDADRRCVVRPEEGRAVAQVWEEARKALWATKVAEEEEDYIYVARYRTQELDPRTLSVRSGEEWERVVVAPVPFVSLDPDVMAEQGFVHPDGDGYIYYGPDSTLLLSEPFLDTHCLRLTASPRRLLEPRDAATRPSPGWIAIEFEPVPGRTVPGIAGALWLDVATSELRRVEYRYVDPLPVRAGRRHAGGRMDFERLPSGVWIVRDWWIRMPVVAPGWRREILHHFLVRGAEIVEVRDRDATLIRE